MWCCGVEGRARWVTGAVVQIGPCLSPLVVESQTSESEGNSQLEAGSRYQARPAPRNPRRGRFEMSMEVGGDNPPLREWLH